MVEANLNKAHHIITYLSLLFLPIILSWLLTKMVETSHDLSCHWEWNHAHLAVRYYPRKHHKKKKARRPSKIEGQAQRKKPLMLTYLLPLALIAFKVGCCVEHSLHHLWAALNISVPSQNCCLCRVHHLTLPNSKNSCRHRLIRHWCGHLCLNYFQKPSGSI